MYMQQHHVAESKMPVAGPRLTRSMLPPVLALVHLERARAGKGVKGARAATAARLLQQRLALAGRRAGGRVEVGQQAPDAGGRARRARRAPERVRGRPVQRRSLAALAACARPRPLSRRVTRAQPVTHPLQIRACQDSGHTWHMMSDVLTNL